MSNTYIVDVVRSPVGKAPRGVFKNTLPDSLLAHVIKAVQKRNPNADWTNIGDVVIGCAMPEAEQGMNIARIATLLAGLPDITPAMTINRFCSSGVQTIATANDEINTCGFEYALAGGVESMSKVPMGGNKYTANPEIFTDENVAIAYGMGITAEIVAKKYNITREEQDNFAIASHQKALNAIKSGYFKAEICAYTVVNHNFDLKAHQSVENTRVVENDEGPRADTSYEKIASLKPVFKANGTVTAGNSSQMSDGAAIALLASENALKRDKITPMGRLLSFAVAGVPPEIMGIGPVVALPKALERAGLTIGDLSWIELNEAFAAQALAVIKELDLPMDIVNPEGGAIALGHPLGATGAIRTATLMHGLKRIGKKYGAVTMCIGTGMGAAAIFECFV